MAEEEIRARRESARAVMGEDDGVECLSTQDGKICAAVGESDSPETRQARTHVGNQFLAFLGEKPFTIDALKLFIRTDCESYAATTMWTRRSHLIRFLKEQFWLHVRDDGLMATDKLLSAKGKSHQKKKASIFSVDQILTFLKTAPDDVLFIRHKVLMLLGVFSLGRIKEVAGMTWANITEDKERQTYIFSLTRCKTNAEDKKQVFFLPFKFYEYDTHHLLETHRTMTGGGELWVRARTSKRLSKTTLAETTKLIAQFLKLPNPDGYTAHGLRATGATAMADHGASELELMTAGNWKSANVARGYIRQSMLSGKRRAELIMGSPAASTAPAPIPTPKTAIDEPPAKKSAVDVTVAGKELFTAIFNNCSITGTVTITVNK